MLLLIAKVATHKTPLEVKNPSLVLQAMKSAKRVGDVWGLDIYLARKNAELLAPAFPNTKAAIVGLFAEKILRTAPWDRPLDDLKYSFYVLRQEKIRSLYGTTVSLIDLKETIRNFGTKGELLDPAEVLILKNLREEERQSTPEGAEGRYRELLWKSGSDRLKARFLIRATALEEQRIGKKDGRAMQQIKAYEQEGILPFSLVLAAGELKKGPPMSLDLMETKKRKLLVRGSEVALQEYQEALEALSKHDYKEFIGKIEKLASEFFQKDFSPVLLYQAWSVAHYDLGDDSRANAILSNLKKEYPASDWAYPERASFFLTKIDTEPANKSWQNKAEQLFLSLNLLRGFFKQTTENGFLKINETAKGLTNGQTIELTLDGKSAENYLEPLLPAFVQKGLRGYQIYLSDEGLVVFIGVKIGIFNVVFSGRGALLVGEDEDVRTTVLRLQEIKVQGVPIPRPFLRQIEKDFETAVKNEAPLMELTEAQYWRGGAKIVFEKRDSQAVQEKKTKAVFVSERAEKKINE